MLFTFVVTCASISFLHFCTRPTNAKPPGGQQYCPGQVYVSADAAAMLLVLVGPPHALNPFQVFSMQEGGLLEP